MSPEDICGGQTFKDGDRDFRTQLAKISEAKPDVVLCSAYYEEGAQILVQAKQLRINVPVLGEDGWPRKMRDTVGGTPTLPGGITASAARSFSSSRFSRPAWQAQPVSARSFSSSRFSRPFFLQAWCFVLQFGLTALRPFFAGASR